ncbi:MAG: N-acetylmuramoyl-L-alanine amidase family protein [Candidatus Bipolaricaulota bacterium]
MIAILVSIVLFTQIAEISPSQIGSFVIVIDPGHGGADSGAAGENGVEEKEITLKIAQLLAFSSYDWPGVKVLLTRRKDVYVNPYDRTGFANEKNADLFISIHADSFGDASIEGSSTFVAEQSGKDSHQLATSLQQALASRSGAEDRGVKRASLFIRQAEMPAALVEVGFLSNPSEARRLNNPSYQRKIARGLQEGIQNYIDKYSKGA